MKFILILNITKFIIYFKFLLNYYTLELNIIKFIKYF